MISFTASTGGIVELLHRISEEMQPQVQQLKEEIRLAPAVQADETGWRENGRNGYLIECQYPDDPLL